ncbi:MAG: hypothetical protein ACLURV_13505 [Gallintestinimicrobium sp.]
MTCAMPSASTARMWAGSALPLIFACSAGIRLSSIGWFAGARYSGDNCEPSFWNIDLQGLTVWIRSGTGESCRL